jgi:hypothetical protein
MSRFIATLALPILLVAVAGCARDWTRPGTSEQEVNADKLNCEQAAARLYPAVREPPLAYRPAASSKLETSCTQQTGFNNCDSAGAGGASAPAAQNNANDYNRAAAVKACLTSKGYTYKKVTR